MNAKILGVALICAVPALIGKAPAFSQDRAPQAAKVANVAMSDLDRCPYYPSPAVCRMWGMGMSAMEHHKTPNNQLAGSGVKTQGQGSAETDYM